MRENLFNSAHKASNEKSRAGWDRTFKDYKGEDMKVKEITKPIDPIEPKGE